MAGEKEVTIYDIARQLNISPATVSRGLKDHPAISSKTKKRIFDMVEAMGYRSNHFARNLRQQRTHTIGVMVHELKSHFITSVLAGIEKVTTGAGYDIIIAHSSESAAKEVSNARNLFHKRVDGLIASLAIETKDLQHFNPFIEKGVPVIFFDRVIQDGAHPVVIIDNYACGFAATAHLAEQGCRRIAHITSSLERNVYAERYRGYRDALQKYALPFDASLLVIKDLSEEGGIAAAQELLGAKPLPDGVFITNDFIAAVCMRHFREQGLAIPRDIAVVGFNNDSISQLIEPALTTIQYPGAAMGEMAAKQLIDHLGGTRELAAPQTFTIPSGLIVRASSLKKGK